MKVLLALIAEDLQREWVTAQSTAHLASRQQGTDAGNNDKNKLESYNIFNLGVDISILIV